MTTAIPALETSRLIVREFTLEDAEDIHRILGDSQGMPAERREGSFARRLSWLRWTVANYGELASLDQPPYGDRALVLKETSKLIGSVGLVPAMGPFRQIPGFPDYDGSTRWFPEVGLFWAIDPTHQQRGYATEAAQALVDRVLEQFHLARIIATTEHGNLGSIGVMRKLGMRVLSNPLPEPSWLQVVGFLK